MSDSAGACRSARKNIYETFWRGQRFIKPDAQVVRTRSMNPRPYSIFDGEWSILGFPQFGTDRWKWLP